MSCWSLAGEDWDSGSFYGSAILVKISDPAFLHGVWAATSLKPGMKRDGARTRQMPGAAGAPEDAAPVSEVPEAPWETVPWLLPLGL